MTPSIFSCTQQCLFCWRAQNADLQLRWNEKPLPNEDSPEEIVAASIKAQHRILSGYKANPKADKKKLKEAMVPKQAAISLAGEPTLYKQLKRLIEVFHGKGFTTFLVSNGTVPSALAKLGTEPTQLYISACAPDKRTLERICRPHISRAWERLNETLALLPSFNCPTVIRMTLACNLNMKNIKGYGRIIETAKSTYVELKAYMHVGFSRLRVSFENTPSHSGIREFASQLSRETGYNIIGESEESRVILLSKLTKPIQFGDK